MEKTIRERVDAKLKEVVIGFKSSIYKLGVHIPLRGNRVGSNSILFCSWDIYEVNYQLKGFDAIENHIFGQGFNIVHADDLVEAFSRLNKIKFHLKNLCIDESDPEYNSFAETMAQISLFTSHLKETLNKHETTENTLMDVNKLNNMDLSLYDGENLDDAEIIKILV